ncbi:MAG: hypothetical protein DKM50_13745 [Candidatus Margulisiibacteriota bacterium]|nr:MAG: hypothetical protein A2X43_13135 [Candidatus Margulisbacteria bacterium GWD2_39_127]OGI00941.1 MAG: hypothetical protein A2X42_03190 [Candidatus Margulisbacteria bacterium GWF2_38_17]OGI09932.1 MAG: hypothetical protein A2X41_05975 [Candidatus Margulisbacteria bacterium GWE2_39_32]PZM77231.1 MAG: hypothetical protein DKM50_13745 [Candidatus Margulisiibacteriota bacterium]HAR64237.1 hypothetical protein [Candidatus Margulisiibacteriota bacterium]
MHICQVIWNIDAIGGTERVVVNLAKGFKQFGTMKVSVISIVGDGKSHYSQELFDDGINLIHLFPKVRKVYNPTITIKLMKTIHGLSPDLIHSHIWGASVHSLLSAKLMNLPLVVHEHNINQTQRSYRNILDKATFSLRNKTIACSQSVHQSLIESFKLINHKEKLSVINNCINEHNMRPSRNRNEVRKELGIGESDFVFISVGRLSKEKNHQSLVEAFHSIAKTYKNSKLLIAGDGPLSEDLRSQLKALHLEKSVTLLGLIKDVPSYLSAADVFVLPSLWEGLPMVVLEAMYLNLPLIASNVGIINTLVINGKTGFLIEPLDISAISGYMKMFIENRALVKKMGQSASDLVKNRFLIESYVRNLSNIYKEILLRN